MPRKYRCIKQQILNEREALSCNSNDGNNELTGAKATNDYKTPIYGLRSLEYKFYVKLHIIKLNLTNGLSLEGPSYTPPPMRKGLNGFLTHI